MQIDRSVRVHRFPSRANCCTVLSWRCFLWIYLIVFATIDCPVAFDSVCHRCCHPFHSKRYERNSCFRVQVMPLHYHSSFCMFSSILCGLGLYRPLDALILQYAWDTHIDNESAAKLKKVHEEFELILNQRREWISCTEVLLHTIVYHPNSSIWLQFSAWTPNDLFYLNTTRSSIPTMILSLCNIPTVNSSNYQRIRRVVESNQVCIVLCAHEPEFHGFSRMPFRVFNWQYLCSMLLRDDSIKS